ncbi:hypothetical protein U0070_023173 [Myodes glareolus]|uniref:Uncharacterized protein n=1 Tax=Myodes glareolus TaxID=447135 RepID=A0AAW0IBI1_MYOGA
MKLGCGQLASCETFPEQMGILGANTVKMLFEVPLACGITHCYAAEMEDSRPTGHDWKIISSHHTRPHSQ